MDKKIAFYKDRSGDIWFMGIYSNNFEDRQGDIITWDAHMEYATWFKEAKIKLPIIMLHQPKYPGYFHLMHTYAMEKGIITPQEYAENMQELYESTTVATAEAVIPINGFVIVVGKVREDRYDMIEKMTGSWGMSHGFINLEHDGKIITKYRTFEFTLAPVEWAANAITLIGFLNEDKSMADEKLTKEERDLLEGFLNGSADNVEDATKKARDILSRVFNSKTLDAVTEEESAEEEPDTTEEVDATKDIDYEALRGKIFADLDVPGLADAFKQMGDVIKQHDQKFAELEQAVKKTDDERVAEYISPDWKWVFADHETEGEQDEELLESLKEKADRKITEDSGEKNKSNPLSQMFWNPISRGEH